MVLLVYNLEGIGKVNTRYIGRYKMIHKIVHYKVKPNKGDVAVAALKDFVAGIAADEPTTFYEAYQAEDGWLTDHPIN